MVQKKKSDEQDVLVVRDEKTCEIVVGAGLSRYCTRKRAPAEWVMMSFLSLFFFCPIIVNV